MLQVIRDDTDVKLYIHNILTIIINSLDTTTMYIHPNCTLV